MKPEEQRELLKSLIEIIVLIYFVNHHVCFTKKLSLGGGKIKGVSNRVVA